MSTKHVILAAFLVLTRGRVDRGGRQRFRHRRRLGVTGAPATSLQIELRNATVVPFNQMNGYSSGGTIAWDNVLRSPMYFEKVSLHEIGHFMDLGDICRRAPSSVMKLRVEVLKSGGRHMQQRLWAICAMVGWLAPWSAVSDASDFPGLSVRASCRNGSSEYSAASEAYPGQRAFLVAIQYSKMIARLGETQLPCVDAIAEGYRLIETLAFDGRQLAIGVARNATTARLWSVLRDSKENRVIRRTQATLTDDQWKSLEAAILELRFWMEPSRLLASPNRGTGNDEGAGRILEGYKQNQYHILIRGGDKPAFQRFRDIVVRIGRLNEQ